LLSQHTHLQKLENHKLHETSLRLEQENDDLAQKLVISKIALRNALDQTEDQVDELTKELLKTKQLLMVTEEEKRGKEEEASQLKGMFRRELDKAEADIKRSNNIITDYKQVNIQLEHSVNIISKMLECERCRHIFSMDGSIQLCSEDEDTCAQDEVKASLREQVQELERELAQTKLQMVESKCKIQELEHQNALLTTELQAAKNTWLRKTLGSFKTAMGDKREAISAPPKMSATDQLLLGQSHMKTI
uniref:Rab GTPase-activating protein 1-like n=1 Tax=Sinocyclocheilus grahami TaxID=75366 RepID=A0A672Q6H3_SINGR